MLFVFLTQIAFFGLFFWNADKLNKALQRSTNPQRAANGGIGINIEL
jgi:hypothetical protein